MSDIFEPVIDIFRALLPWFIAFGVLLSLFFFFGIIYVVISMQKLAAAEKAKEQANNPASTAAKTAEKPVFKKPEGNTRWERILAQVASDNPSDWRFAIIDADIILDEMMSKMGYRGKDLGEKLKSVEKSDFETIELAWEGHKIRNRIAHTGADFVLSKRETERVINLYKKVFQEFEYI